MTESQRKLLATIGAAFRGVELGDGVSLHQTVAIDDYAGPEAERAAWAADERGDWRRLVRDPELARIGGVGGLSFYDAAGLRFHLPAYLSLAVTEWDSADTGDVLGSLMHHLTSLDEYNTDRFAILTAEQRRCVADVLTFIRDEYEPYSYLDDISRAVSEYWRAEREGDGPEAGGG